MPVYDDYMPEELEPETRELTSLLEYMYQQPAAAERIQDAEHARLLVRARARLLNAEHALLEEEQDTCPLLILVDADNSIIPADVVPSRAQPIKPRKGLRFSRTLNAIAAMLVVCGLIAGAVALFTRHASNVGSPAETQSSSCFLNMDAGLVYVCQHRLYQSFNNSKDIAGYHVTLTRAYADRTRIVVSAEMTKLSNNTKVVGLILGDLTTTEGIVLTSAAGKGAPDGSGDEAVNIYAFPATLDKASTLALHLKMEIVPKMGGQIPAKDIHDLSFVFSLPVHSELRTITINQEMTLAQGGTLAIKDLRISLSEAVFDVTYKPEKNSSLPLGADLTVRNGHYTDDGTWANLLHIYATSSDSPFAGTIKFSYSLYNVHGAAELMVRDGGQDSSSYHFAIA